MVLQRLLLVVSSPGGKSPRLLLVCHPLERLVRVGGPKERGVRMRSKLWGVRVTKKGEFEGREGVISAAKNVNWWPVLIDGDPVKESKGKVFRQKQGKRTLRR